MKRSTVLRRGSSFRRRLKTVSGRQTGMNAVRAFVPRFVCLKFIYLVGPPLFAHRDHKLTKIDHTAFGRDCRVHTTVRTYNVKPKLPTQNDRICVNRVPTRDTTRRYYSYRSLYIIIPHELFVVCG